MASTWSRMRGWLGWGPTRAELVAEVELWKRRRDRVEQERNAAHARAKAAEKELRQAAVRERDLESRISELLVAALNEPGRVEGCEKVRFHQQDEAGGWRDRLSKLSREPVEVFTVYGCKTCPRSPVTMRPYWHVGHLGSEAAQKSKAAAAQRRAEERNKARRAGLLLGQRVDPGVLAKLHQMREGR